MVVMGFIKGKMLEKSKMSGGATKTIHSEISLLAYYTPRDWYLVISVHLIS